MIKQRINKILRFLFFLINIFLNLFGFIRVYLCKSVAKILRFVL